MRKMVVAASHLQAGDLVVAAGCRVTGVQFLGSVLIVDLDDNTATPPIPSNVAVEIRR